MENLPYTRVQILIDGGESAAIRLDRSYYLTGEQGPADPLSLGRKPAAEPVQHRRPADGSMAKPGF